jgi:hypothetical protein
LAKERNPENLNKLLWFFNLKPNFCQLLRSRDKSEKTTVHKVRNDRGFVVNNLSRFLGRLPGCPKNLYFAASNGSNFQIGFQAGFEF